MSTVIHNVTRFRALPRSALSWVAALGLLACGGCGPRDSADKVEDPVSHGWKLFQQGEFNSARRAFEHEPGSLMARYGLATTLNLMRPDPDPARARALYESIVQEAPRDELAGWSLLALARMEHIVPVGDEPDYAAVRAAYEKVITQYPGHPAAAEAFLYQQSTYLIHPDRAEVQELVARLQAFLAAQTDRKSHSAAQALLAKCHEYLDEPEAWLAAEIASLQTREIDWSNPRLDLSSDYWRIAVIAEFEAGDLAAARTYYQKLIEEYPTDVRIYSARRALKRMDELEAQLRKEGSPG